MPPLADRLHEGKLLLLDGAMGTELDHRGAPTYLPLWSAWGLIDHPEVVRAIHDDYARAGADILTTNTFRTTGRALQRGGRDPDEAQTLTALAVRLARESATGTSRTPLVAGSIAPLEDCYSPWLSPSYDIAFSEHRILANDLAAAGADFVMVETMPLIEEAEAAAAAALETGLEVTVGFVIGNDGRLLSGEYLADAVQRLSKLPISAIFINCTPMTVIAPAMAELAQETSLPVGGYANLGTVENSVGWAADASITTEEYAVAALGWVASGARIIGGCCGTRPAHIAAMRRAIDELPRQNQLALQ
jgi:S-methylmethionine-dependent homocysteine/selenocysteine methylase